jgi:ketosteroid isomerase-like protein
VSTGDERDIRAVLDRLAGATELETVKRCITADAELYDVWPPLRVGHERVHADFEYFFENFRDISVQLLDVTIVCSEELAVARSIQDQSATVKADNRRVRIVVRVTDALTKRDGQWRIFHEHLSVPVDILSGRAHLELALESEDHE